MQTYTKTETSMNAANQSIFQKNIVQCMMFICWLRTWFWLKSPFVKHFNSVQFDDIHLIWMTWFRFQAKSMTVMTVIFHTMLISIIVSCSNCSNTQCSLLIYEIAKFKIWLSHKHAHTHTKLAAKPLKLCFQLLGKLVAKNMAATKWKR